jgi:putative membrane protein
MKGSYPVKRSFSAYFVLAVKGFCMGASDVIPGVSGGTMAFILGIYRELIASIRSFDLRFFRLLLSFKIKDALNHASWKFPLAVGTGILIAIFTLAKAISWLLHNQPILIWSFFFGLILASVLTVSRHFSKWSPSIILWITLGAVFTYFLVGLVPAATPNSAWFLFISGAIAICAMILPGISGAFILVLLGKYHYVLEAVNNRDFFTLFLVASGAVVGLVSFVRLLNWLFTRYHNFTIAILTGLMLGSLRKIWPWKRTISMVSGALKNETAAIQGNVLPTQWDTEATVAVGLMILGFLIVLCLDRLARRER